MQTYRKNWMVVAAMSCLCGVSIGIVQNTVGVFYAPVSQSTGILRGTIAMLSMVSMATANILALAIPKFINEKNFKPCIFTGMLLTSGGSLLMAFSEHAWQFIACGAIRGIGCACIGLVFITMVLNQWFASNLGFATSLVFGSSGLVGAIGSTFLNHINETYGWSYGFLVTAILVILMCLPACLLRFTIHPENCGCVPYGVTNTTSETDKTPSNFSFASYAFLTICVISIAGNVCTALPQHFPGYAQSLGYTATLGATMLSFNMAFNIIGKIIGGNLEKKIGSGFTCLLAMVVSFIGLFLVLQGFSTTALSVGSMFYGFIYVTTTISLVTLTKANFGRENYARYYPIIQLAGGITNAVSLPLIGYLFDFTGSYRVAFVFALILIGLMFGLLIGLLLKNKKPIQSKG